ncbi:hypothetical protein VTN96DRAFT_6694 [Rasamsonia emersonii]
MQSGDGANAPARARGCRDAKRSSIAKQRPQISSDRQTGCKAVDGGHRAARFGTAPSRRPVPPFPANTAIAGSAVHVGNEHGIILGLRQSCTSTAATAPFSRFLLLFLQSRLMNGLAIHY